MEQPGGSSTLPYSSAAPHQTLLALLACGLSYSEARSISFEEVLCLLACKAHEDELRWLDSEGARVASLSCADSQEQARLLLALQHRARRAAERFTGA